MNKMSLSPQSKTKTQKRSKASPKKKETKLDSELQNKKSEKTSPYLLVLDAHAMAYRSYYALQKQELRDPVTGMPTQAIYGFLRMFFRLLLEYAPEHCAVVWDSRGPGFRTRLYRDYKATRKAMPEELGLQIEEIQAILEENGFCNIELPDYEADDVMGTLAKHYGHTKKKQVFLISGDKDCYQLLDENVLMLRSLKGVSDFLKIDPAWVEKELGISTTQITDYMGLVGDSSDNIPGVEGIGPKSASKLLQEYKSLENIYAKIKSISPKGIQDKLKKHEKEAFLSRDLAIIQTELKKIEELDINKCKTPDFLSRKVLEYFQKKSYTQIYLELKKAQTQGTHLSSKKGNQEGDLFSAPSSSKRLQDPKLKYKMIQSTKELKESLEEIQRKMKKEKRIALDTETNSTQALEAQLLGISLSVKEREAIYIPLSSGAALSEGRSLSWEEAGPILKKFLEDPQLRIIGQNLKYDYTVLDRWGIHLPAPYFDTMLASYLCNPTLRRHSLDAMALDLLAYEKISYEELVGKGKQKKTLEDLEPEEVYEYACEDADICLGLYHILKKEIRKKKLDKVYNEIEMPLLPILGHMEKEGVAIDKEYFRKLSEQYLKKLSGLKKKIYEYAGYEFNIHSTRELQKLLFEELKLPRGRKTKTGYSTDQGVLESLSGLHPLVDNILEHRKCSKLHSTYIEALPRLVNPQSQRIHTSFNQSVTATGRLSSANPNLQNIPIREESGRAIRRGFIAAPGNILISMDYSQIELRIMAHYAKDQALIEALKEEGRDIHRSTASSLFGVEEEKVTEEMRSQGKIVNFAIIYGVTDFGLARNLGVERSLAAEYIQRFFRKYPGVRTYMDTIIAFALEKGYVETLTGRIRPIPDIKASNRFRREGAERSAVNSPIQGTSADVIKIAMIDIERKLREKKLGARMILQVHDELLFDVPPAEEKEVFEIARKSMEGAMDLAVPLSVQGGLGKNWDEAH